MSPESVTPSPHSAQPTRRQLIALLVASLGLSSNRSRASSPRESDTQRLFEAIEQGDLAGVRSLLERSPVLAEVRDQAGRSGYAGALTAAGARPEPPDGVYQRIARLFLDAGYERDLVETCLARDWEALSQFEFSRETVAAEHPVGGTAMAVAARRGIGSDIWRLYALGGDPDDFADDPPLLAAFDDPDLARAEITAATLLGNGADPNARRGDANTALHLAATRGSDEMVEMLLRWGAVPDARDASGRTPLSLAERNGHQNCARLLQRQATIPRVHSTSRLAYDSSGEPYRPPSLDDLPLELRARIVGVSHGDLGAVEELLRTEPRLVHARATTTEGTVEACAHTGRHEIVDLLLEHGAPCSLPTAVMRNDLRRAQALLDEDPARIEERGPHGFALLWYPAIGGQLLDMAALLLERLSRQGRDVEDQHYLGTTALHWAAMQGQAELVELLLEHGADPQRVGRKFGPLGQTPIDIARQRGHDVVVDKLEKSVRSGV